MSEIQYVNRLDLGDRMYLECAYPRLLHDARSSLCYVTRATGTYSLTLSRLSLPRSPNPLIKTTQMRSSPTQAVQSALNNSYLLS